LFPSLVGLPEQSMAIPGTIADIATSVLLIGLLWWSWRSRRWPLAVGGIALIVGGYLLTCAARARPGDLSIFQVSRYHLFPQIGLVCLIVAAPGGFLQRLDGRRLRGWLVATLLAAFLVLLQSRGMRLAAEGRFRYPDQPRLLAAAARLEELGRSEGITFDQFFRALDPVQPRWARHPWPFHPILFLFRRDPSSEARMADSSVRDAIIAALSKEEREVIFGGMEATKYRQTALNGENGEPLPIARLVATCRITRLDEGRYEVLEGPAYLEFQIDPAADDSRALSLPDLKADWPVEVWWAGPLEAWSSGRSVRWAPDPGLPSRDLAVPIGAFPHWRRGSVRRLRIVPGGSGTMALGSPRFLR